MTCCVVHYHLWLEHNLRVHSATLPPGVESRLIALLAKLSEWMCSFGVVALIRSLSGTQSLIELVILVQKITNSKKFGEWPDVLVGA